MRNLVKFGGIFAALMVATAARADNVQFVPEPGALSLVGLAIGVAALVARRKK